MIFELGDRICKIGDKTVYIIIGLEKTTNGNLTRYFGWVIKENHTTSSEKCVLMDIMDDTISVYVTLQEGPSKQNGGIR